MTTEAHQTRLRYFLLFLTVTPLLEVLDPVPCVFRVVASSFPTRNMAAYCFFISSKAFATIPNGSNGSFSTGLGRLVEYREIVSGFVGTPNVDVDN